MNDTDRDLAVLRALADVEARLAEKWLEIAKRSGPGSASQNLVIRETHGRTEVDAPPGARFGLWVAAAVVERRRDGREVEWFCDARNPLDGSGWTVEREVHLNESPVGEAVTLGTTELATLTFVNTEPFVRVLPELVEELLRVPAPDPSPE